jgi:hypothetical protein
MEPSVEGTSIIHLRLIKPMKFSPIANDPRQSHHIALYDSLFRAIEDFEANRVIRKSVINTNIINNMDSS